MVTELLIASCYFGAGLVVGIATLLGGVALGRISRGEDPGEIRGMFPGGYRSDKYPETKDEIWDDEHFDRATMFPDEGGLENPTDDQLEILNRHTNM